MKEALFEMLLNFFETTLLRLKEVAVPEEKHALSMDEKQSVAVTTSAMSKSEKANSDIYHMMILKEASQNATRVFSYDEQMKLSKSSYQFLMRLSEWGVISRDMMELIINRLLLSDSNIVSLRETKWIIRTLLADKITYDQLGYLDLVLYHQEDAIVKH
jgi:uncharacterized protein Smg (DUF494 family)